MTIQRLEASTLDVAPATKARIARTLRVPLAALWPLENDGSPVSEVHQDDEPVGSGLEVESPPEVATDEYSV